MLSSLILSLTEDLPKNLLSGVDWVVWEASEVDLSGKHSEPVPLFKPTCSRHRFEVSASLMSAVSN